MRSLLIISILFISEIVFSQNNVLTKEDTLIGSNTVFRSWWDVKRYDLVLQPDFNTKSISGSNQIYYQVISDSLPFIMQLDLQMPMRVEALSVDYETYNNFRIENNRLLISLPNQAINSFHKINVNFSGTPKEAKNPPWDGGWVWKKDSLGNPWMSAACQGAGASVWFPCKDLQSDEPDNGCSINITVPDSLVAISNGRLIRKRPTPVYNLNGSGYTEYLWEVKNPINSYDIIPYIGKYTNIHDSIIGENGKLITDYWVLNYHLAKAKAHLKPNVTKTLKCLEHWFGPYPFYDDTYKIVEAPYLGMEHQSNVAYGNHYLNGYAGTDRSKTGWGLKWDFIVVHETAHEWFGNSITAKDVADNWIHEGFASYAEALFTECEFGKEAGSDYCEGVKKSIDNDIPVIGIYGVKKEGSGDMYNKGSQVIQMIRQLMDDDKKFRFILRDLSKNFYHKIVTTKEFEDYLILKTGKNLKPIFDQYLRTTQIPQLEYKLTKMKLEFRYTNCIDNFNMPVKIKTDKEFWISPTTQWQTMALKKDFKTISLDRNMYVELVK